MNKKEEGFPKRDPSLTGDDVEDDEIPEMPEGFHDELGIE